MQIQSHIHPELEVIRQVRALEAACKAEDGLAGMLFLDPSLNFSPDIPCLLTLHENGELVALLTIFAPSQAEAELVGMTHPAYRNKGYFRTLARRAAETAQSFSIPDLLFVCEQTSLHGVSAVRALGAAPDFSEYSLRYDRAAKNEPRAVPAGLTLREATPADLDDLCAISAACFPEPPEQTRRLLLRSMESENRAQYVAHLDGEPAGICAIGYEENEATIFGLAVAPALQNKGIGRGILALIRNVLLEQNVSSLLIEVDSTNAPALHLYLSCGFVAEAVNGYYRLPVGRFLGQADARQE